MNFLSIRGRAWSIVVIRGITVALELLALVLWAQPAGKVLLKVIVAFCFLSVVYECFAFRGLKAGSGEAEDEQGPGPHVESVGSGNDLFSAAFGCSRFGHGDFHAVCR